MTAISRRHVVAGAAVTVAAAALPAVAVAEAVEAENMIGPTSTCILQFTSTADFLDFIAGGSDWSGIEWAFV